jgi:carbamoyltransferase
MKKILGIQKDHNSGACLFYDDELIYYNQEERLSRIKGDSGLPIETLKKICELSSEIDVLVISGYDNFQAENHSIMSIIKKLGFKFSQSFEFVPYHKSHHLVHAAKAFYSSEFKDALVVVQDGRGSYYNLNNGGIACETTSVFSVNMFGNFELIHRRFFTHSKIDNDTKIVWNNNFTLDKIDTLTYAIKNTVADIRNDYDLGFMYEGTSRSLGFNDAGGKMMGLQSYGKHDETLPQILDDNLVFNMKVFHFDRNNKHKQLDTMRYPELMSNEAKTNFAFMVQKSFEKAGLQLITDMLAKTGHKNLILTGGTALNVVANNFYRQNLSKHINMYIEPVCGDEGNCIGICQYYYNQHHKSTEIKKSLSIYMCGANPSYDFLLNDSEVEIDADETVIAEILKAGHIVAVFQGKGEAGPRALGNRSLLYDPRVVKGKDIVNSIKQREMFRPFAAAIMLEHVNDWFELGNIDESPLMMYAVGVKDDAKDKIPAVVHVDNTCRIQTVTDKQNYHLYNIIKSFYNTTGVPMLLNTSFNLAGDPIVETIQDAIDSLRKSKLEYLYLPEINKLIYVKN